MKRLLVLLMLSTIFYGNPTFGKDQVLNELVRLLADEYKYGNPINKFMSDFDALGCKSQWRMTYKNQTWRNERVQSLIKQYPALKKKLQNGKTPEILFIKARLIDLKIESGLKLSESSDSLLKQSAAAGHGEAKLYLALQMMKQYPYYDNKPVDAAKFDEINRLLEDAAKHGSVSAGYHLGFRNQPHTYFHAHDDGKSLRPPPPPLRARTQERHWYCLAAARGDMEAQKMCSNAMFIGLGGPANQEEGMALLKRAAESGNDIAAYDLARKFEMESGASLEKAFEWHCRAISLGNQWSGKALRDKKFSSFVKEVPEPSHTVENSNQQSKTKENPTQQKSFIDFLNEIEPESGLQEIDFSTKQKDILKKLRDLLINPPLSGYPNLDSIEKLSCPKDIRDDAEKIIRIYKESKLPIARSGYKLSQQVYALLDQDKEIEKVIWRSNDADATFVFAMLLKEGLAIGTTKRSKNQELSYLRASELGRSLHARFELLQRYSQRNMGRKEIAEELETMAEGGIGAAAFDLSYLYQPGTPRWESQNQHFIPLAKRFETRKWACQSAKLGFIKGKTECGIDMLSGIGGDIDKEKGLVWLKQAADAGDHRAAMQIARKYEAEGDLRNNMLWRCQSYLNGGDFR